MPAESKRVSSRGLAFDKKGYPLEGLTRSYDNAAASAGRESTRFLRFLMKNLLHQETTTPSWRPRREPPKDRWRRSNDTSSSSGKKLRTCKPEKASWQSLRRNNFQPHVRSLFRGNANENRQPAAMTSSFSVSPSRSSVLGQCTGDPLRRRRIATSRGMRTVSCVWRKCVQDKFLSAKGPNRTILHVYISSETLCARTVEPREANQRTGKQPVPPRDPREEEALRRGAVP